MMPGNGLSLSHSDAGRLGSDSHVPSRIGNGVEASAPSNRTRQVPRASIIINNYNYEHLVGQAIDSALAQSFPEKEIIVVDDGSIDGSREVLQRYLGKDVRVVLQENRGQAGAINAGVAASTGEIICFLDSDDWWAPDKVSRVVEAFSRNPTTSLVYHRLQPVRSNGAFALKPIPRSLCSGDLAPRLKRTAGWWPFPLTSAVAVRRSAWEMAGAIPECFRISADAWLVGVVPFLGHVVAIPEALGFYRLHNNNWYRQTDDAPMLRRRMDHWELTIEQTNRFLAGQGSASRVQLSDHYPYQVAAAQLGGVGMMQRLALAAQGVCFQGEPNLLRRFRDVLRTVPNLPAAEPAKQRAGSLE
jgi:hypothetical protein